MQCHNCGDKGLPGGCPKCGLTPRAVSKMRLDRVIVPNDIIPVSYQGVSWDSPTKDDDPLKFKKFDASLSKVHDKFLCGEIPAFSMFISTPPKYGKNVFAYSCMQAALANRFSVAPLLSTSDWRRLNKVSQMNPFYKLYGKYQWDTLISVDVVFLSIDHGDDRYDDIPLLKTILDTRAAFNLATFIISDYRLNDLVPKWNSNIYSIIHNDDPQRDMLRYPVVLHRFE